MTIRSTKEYLVRVLSGSGCMASGEPGKLFLLGGRDSPVVATQLDQRLCSVFFQHCPWDGHWSCQHYSGEKHPHREGLSREKSRNGGMLYKPDNSFHVRSQKLITPSRIGSHEGEFCATEILRPGLFLNTSSL